MFDFFLADLNFCLAALTLHFVGIRGSAVLAIGAEIAQKHHVTGAVRAFSNETSHGRYIGIPRDQLERLVALAAAWL